MQQDKRRNDRSFTITRRGALGTLAAGLSAAALGDSWALAAGPAYRGGTLTGVLELDVHGLDPLFGSTSVDRKVFGLYSESLLYQNKQSELEPRLAESWEVADGGKTITFHLRKGIKFTDGTQFDAKAAKYNLDRLIDPALSPYPRQFVRELESVEVVDDYTVRTHLKEASVLFLPVMSTEAGAMVSPTALAKGTDAFAANPAGTGPFKFVSRVGGKITAERNENYWRMGEDGKSLPYLDRVELTVNPNSTVRLLQIQSGDADIIDAVTVKDFAKVRSDPKLQLLESNLGGAYVLSFNVTQPPFKDNINLRKAVALAIDRQAFVKVITYGDGVALKGIEPPFSWVYDDSLRGHVHNLDEAKAAAKESGFDGDLTLSVVKRDPDGQIARDDSADAEADRHQYEDRGHGASCLGRQGPASPAPDEPVAFVSAAPGRRYAVQLQLQPTRYVQLFRLQRRRDFQSR